MIFVKKSAVYNIIFALVLIFAISPDCKNEQENMSVYSPAGCGKTIIIDPGHGYPDAGAISFDGTREKDLNLEVSKKLGSLFLHTGFKVVYTREDDFGLVQSRHDKTKTLKIHDLNARRKIMEENPDAIFISIHMNKFSNPIYKGAQVFYDGKNEACEMLAKNVQRFIAKYVDSSNQRQAKDCENSIYILKESPIPAVLIECGFLSNSEELEKLKSDKYQTDLSFAIFSAVTDFISKQK